MDSHLRIPVRPKEKPFMLSIESCFNIPGRGCVVTGTIENGIIKPNSEAEIVGMQKDIVKTSVISLETFNKQLDYGEAGDNVGVLIRGLKKEDVKRG